MEKKEQLIEAVLKLAGSKQASEETKQLNCAEAFELAKRYEVKVTEIGQICNQHNIRICHCQLGCFA